MYIYFYSLHVSASYVSIIRRIITAMRHLVYVTHRLVCRSMYSRIPDGNLHRVSCDIWFISVTVWYAGAYAPAYQTVIYTE